MNDVSLRRLLRSIALGLPLAVPGTGLVLTPTLLGCGTCEGFEEHEEVRVAEITSGGEGTPVCETVCVERFGQAPSSCSLDSPTSASCTYVQRVHQTCGAGRRANAPAVRAARGAASAWLLETALLEASAVTAFRRTARALAAHGAPCSLVRRASVSAEDERRHTKMIVRLAAEHGSVSLSVRTDVSETPSLAALALENAREGCVGEAWGAIEAHAQAALAEDPRVRVTMAAIARDEAMHALLSLDIDAWARARAPATTASLDRARTEAHASLRSSLTLRSADALGLPHGESALALAGLLAA